jgi:hypothetical protein
MLDGAMSRSRGRERPANFVGNTLLASGGVMLAIPVRHANRRPGHGRRRDDRDALR